MKVTKIGLSIVFCLYIANILFHLDYSNLSWNNNAYGYLKIISIFIFLIIIKKIAEKTSKYKK
jgi:hypothetical protein